MILDFRWVFMVLGLFSVWALLGKGQIRLKSSVEKHTMYWQTGIAFSFFSIAALAKALQLSANELHAQDFWLFVDALEQASHGAPWLTRFAPQSEGWVQHASVHAFLPLVLFVPLVWIIGAKWTALLINPVGLALGGFFLGRITRFKWGSTGSIFWMLAFYGLSSNGKTLMYETHPEALYPALFFSVLLAGNGWLGALATIACFSLKLDVIGFLAPMLMMSTSRFRLLTFALTGLSLQVGVLKAASMGILGPSSWMGDPVVVASIGGMGATVTVSQAVEKIEVLFNFLVSRPLLSLIVPVLWILLTPAWWVGALGLGFIYSWVPGALPLWNYYSAPWVALAFGVASQHLPSGDPIRRRNWLIGLVILATVLGGSSPRWKLQSSEDKKASQIKADQAIKALECIRSKVLSPKSSQRGVSGVVAPSLISFVWDSHRSMIQMDRSPSLKSLDHRIDFVLLERDTDRYGFSLQDAQELSRVLQGQSRWASVDSDCALSSALSAWVWR